MREILAPPSARTVLARILRNLKGAYLERDDVPHALSAVERILLVEGNTPTELRDRGLLNARLGHLHRALDDLDAYARLGTNATDRESVRRHARSLIERIGHSS
jgi:regulator of sirC expression with transglutaminase-like and TPR domain